MYVRPKLSFALVAGACLLYGAAPAAAQVGFGPQVSYAEDFDLGIGARLQFGMGSLFGDEGIPGSLIGIAAFDWFFPDCGDIDCSYLEFNANGAYPFARESEFSPYLGAGLHFARWSSDADTGLGDLGDDATEIGLNLLGGLLYDLGSFSAFGEGRFEIGGGEQFVLTLGILFGGGL